jgi:hypothetical protein
VAPARERIPASIIAVLVMLALLLAAVAGPELAGAGPRGRGLVELLLVFGIGAGVVMRHPAAWQAGRNLAVLWTVGLCFLLLASLAQRDASGAAGAGVLIALQLTLAVLLSSRAARAWFGLRCPVCTAVEGRPVLGARGAFGCLACGSTWRQLKSSPKTNEPARH